MACFLVPAAEAVVTGVAKKVVENKELASEAGEEAVTHVPFSVKLGWLFKMLIGGSVLLMFEHLWHGEVVPFFPFLSAMRDPEDAAEMFAEMGTVGVTMAVLITVVWVGMVLVSNAMEKRAASEAVAAEEDK